MATWQGPPVPAFPAPGALGWLRIIWRGAVFTGAMIVLMLAFWIGRGLERIWGGRALSGGVIRFACILSAWVFGLRVETEGAPMAHGGALVCNHSSWLDIFVIRAAAQVFFVSKAEVRGWPVFGFIADQTGTLFIARKRTEAKRQEAQFAERIGAGHRLCFFPEGTSTDGLRVLPFKSTLFSAFVSDQLKEQTWIQPVSVVYIPADGLPDAFYGWWGNMGFGEHMLDIMARSRGGRARLIFHPPQKAAEASGRKELAAYSETQVRAAHADALGARGVTAPPV